MYNLCQPFIFFYLCVIYCWCITYLMVLLFFVIMLRTVLYTFASFYFLCAINLFTDVDLLRLYLDCISWQWLRTSVVKIPIECLLFISTEYVCGFIFNNNIYDRSIILKGFTSLLFLILPHGPFFYIFNCLFVYYVI